MANYATNKGPVIWIIGSSYIRRGEERARETIGALRPRFTGLAGVDFDGTDSFLSSTGPSEEEQPWMSCWFTAAGTTWDAGRASISSQRWSRICNISISISLRWPLCCLTSPRDVGGDRAFRGKLTSPVNGWTVSWLPLSWECRGVLCITLKLYLTSLNCF